MGIISALISIIIIGVVWLSKSSERKEQDAKLSQFKNDFKNWTK